MNRVLPFALLLAGLRLASSPLITQKNISTGNTIAIAHVTVIDGTGAPAKLDQTVLIEGDRTVAIGPAASSHPPSTAKIVDARGLYLIPGLWDVHVHVWHADRAFPMFLANGVTGVRNTGGHADDLKRWRQELREGKRQGPVLVACGPVVDGPPPVHPDHSVVVESAAQGRAAVDDLKSQGWDFVKVYENLSRESYFAIAAEARKDGIPFVGHVPVSIAALEASDAGQRSIEHLDGLDYMISPKGDEFRRDRLERIGKPLQPGEMMKLPMRIANELTQLADTYDARRAADLFAHLARNGTWLVPTLSVTHVYASIGDAAMYGDKRLAYADPQERDDWEHNPIVHIEIPEYVAARKRGLQNALRITREAHEAGVRILTGTDSGGVPYLYYGFSVHDELALLVEAGFTPMQALQSATRDPAEFLGLNDRGTIEAGKQADLVLLRADPLADINNTRKIEAVVHGGKLMTRRELDALLSSVRGK
ncbi:MAG TPA: amidohydrolase family protein [Candidatus Sulfotelmatobacter sp.]|nr:amidohydrolase family protein [Candidatus Sulfotelmatobacter sp.]